MTTQQIPPNQAPPKGRGCFFYGCLTSVILVLLVVVAGYFGMRSVFTSLVTNYTQTSPMPLPKVEIAADDLAPLQARVKEFKDAVDKHQPAGSLVLTEKELNALIANDPDLKKLKDKVYVAIDGDQLKGRISYPLGKVALMDFTGRYLNGDATFKVSLENGVLIVTMQSMKVGGKEVPENVMQTLRQTNLAKDVYKDVKTAEAIRKLESIEVKDSRITIKARAVAKTE